MKFQCLESCGGKCCKASFVGEAGGFIFMTDDDVVRIERHTGMDASQFANIGDFESVRYMTFAKPKRLYYMKWSEHKCRFEKDGKCSIYEARPTQCRTFPFWPENMNTRTMSKLSQQCPGIGVGDDIPDVQLAAQLDVQIKADVGMLDP